MAMVTGFCDSKPLLDLHKKTEEKCVSLGAWANACEPKDPWQAQGDEPKGSEGAWAKSLQRSTDDEDIIVGFPNDGQTCSDGSILKIQGYEQPDVCSNGAMLLNPHDFQGLHSLQALIPSLLQHEVETAMEKLTLISDRTYAWDIFLDMMRNQFQSCFSSAELPQPYTDTTYAVLVDWLMQVNDLFNFQEETLCLAVHLLNHSLRQIKVSTSKLQLIAVVCLFLAAKKEESLLPEVSELCYLMDNTYTKHQLLRMERKVLSALHFDLSHCSPLHFLLLSAAIARCSAKVVWMARYLLNLSLMESQCVVFLPVQLAGAALCLARRVLQEPPTPEGETAWCVASSIYVGSEDTLLRIMHILAEAAAKAYSREAPSFIKFSSREAMHVSNHPILQNALCMLPVLRT